MERQTHIKTNWILGASAKARLKRLLSHLCLIVLSVVFISPFLWMLSTSLKVNTQIFMFPPKWIPDPVSWHNYVEALTAIPFFLFLKNTLIYAILSSLGAVLSSSLAAYGFSRIKWPGRDAAFVLVLSTMMLPSHVTMIPLFLTFKNMGLIGTLWPLILPYYFGWPFFIFLMRQFFLGIPQEISDAAEIDGCSEFGIYMKILLPLSKPVVASVILFQFLHSWRDFLGPLIYLNSESQYTLSLGLQMFQRLHDTEWALLMAASTVMTIPIIILFFFTQRTFIQGISMTGIKG